MLLRAILLAILVQMVGLGLVLQLGVGGVEAAVVPFWPLAAVIGGFVFGLAWSMPRAARARSGTGSATATWAR